MIIAIIATWMGFLVILVKLRILKRWSRWMKISPLVIWALCQVFILLPLNVDAPKGNLIVISQTVPIVPSVSGVVTEVPIQSNVPLKKGDVLFKVDPVIYEAEVKRLESKLAQDEAELARREGIAAKGGVSLEEVGRGRSDVAQLKSQLVVARWNLEQTTVKAPVDGFVGSLSLRPGARVVANSSEVMSFIDSGDQAVLVQVQQNHLRNVRAGQPAEVILKLLPGRVFNATVDKVIRANPKGQLSMGGKVIDSFQVTAEPYWVRLKMEEENLELPAGAAGQAAIYTGSRLSGLTRQLTLRMNNWLNFLRSQL